MAKAFMTLGKFTIVLSLVLFGVGSISGQTDPSDWGIAIHHDGVRTPGEPHGDLSMIEGDPLVGQLSIDTCSGKGPDGRFPQIIIEGHQSPDGRFWPNVELQVKDERDGKWIKVASLNEPVSAKLILLGDMGVYGCRINLEPLRPYLGKHKTGRALLTSGLAVTLNLSDLVRPSDKTTK